MILYCVCCELNNQKRRAIPRDCGTRAQDILEYVHADILGPVAPVSLDGHRYSIGFVDSCSRYCKVYFMKSREETLEKVQQFCADVGKPRVLVTDGASEFISKEIKSWYRTKGIRTELSAPYTPEENGKIERTWGTVVGMARCIIHDAGLSKEYWIYALNYAFHLKNMCLHSAINKTPYEVMYKVKPNVSFLKVFGCKVYAFIEKQFRTKFDSTAREGVFLGFSDNSKTYIIGIDKGDGTLKTIKTRSAKFDEEVYFAKPSSEQKQSDTELHSNEPDLSFSATKSEQLLNVESPKQEPRDINEALETPEWRTAMEEEYNSLQSNKVWKLEQLPNGTKPLKGKWHFAVKYNADGTVNKYKARFVAKGFSQKEGVDYNETYSPTARLTTIRVLLNLAAQYEVCPKQLDIKTAFLNAKIDEDIYLEQPEGFEGTDLNGGKLYCKLEKSLYGLKQSGRNWYLTLKSCLEKIGFKECSFDKCLLVCGEGENLSVACMWVDDILYWSRRKSFTEWFENEIKANFDVSDCKDLNWFLGMKINCEPGKITVSQKYIDEMLKKFGMTECKPVDTPMVEKTVLCKEQCPKTEEEKEVMGKRDYRGLVGSLNYLAQTCRPDIANAVHALSSFLINPGIEHWIAAKRVLRYLKGQRDSKLVFKKSDSGIELSAFSDADWAGNIDNRKSTSGMCVKLNAKSGCVSWQSKIQSNVATSTAEAEVNACVALCHETIFISGVLNALGVSVEKPVVLNVDNQACIALSRHSVHHSKTKHFAIKTHYLQDLSEKGEIVFNYVEIENMSADILTKPLRKTKLMKFKGFLMNP